MLFKSNSKWKKTNDVFIAIMTIMPKIAMAVIMTVIMTVTMTVIITQ